MIAAHLCFTEIGADDPMASVSMPNFLEAEEMCVAKMLCEPLNLLILKGISQHNSRCVHSVLSCKYTHIYIYIYDITIPITLLTSMKKLGEEKWTANQQVYMVCVCSM